MEKTWEDVTSMMSIEGQAVDTTGIDQQRYVGDAIHFFLNSKRSGGRSQKTAKDYKKKPVLFQS